MIKSSTSSTLIPALPAISGFHRLITFIRFKIDTDKIKNLEIMEFERKQSPNDIDI